MPEEKDKSITSYYKYLTDIFDIATKNWLNGEGWLEAKVNNDKGFRQARVDGSQTKRVSEKEDGE